MKPQVLTHADYVVMPWKNGQGETAQIAIHPPDAAFPGGDFLWRLSSATVRAGGPFSRFPGYERWLVVLSGDGLAISGGDTLEVGEPLRFSGDNEVSCSLRGSPVTDLGLIWKPGAPEVIDPRFRVLPRVSEPRLLKVERATAFLHAVAGTARISVMGSGEADRVFALKAGETLRTTGPCSLQIEAPDSWFAQIEI